MNLAYGFVLSLYLKRFFTFLIGSELFFLLIDFLQNQKYLPSSANQITLYVYYQAIAGLNLTLPLTLCFGVIGAFSTLSKTNEGMALLSLGFSKKQMVAPMIFGALAVGFAHILLLSSDAGRSYDSAQAILKGQNRIFDDGGLMFKFQNSLVSAEQIDWIASQAKGVRIFEFDGQTPIKMIYAKTADYKNDAWLLKDAISIEIPQAKELNASAIPHKTSLGDIKTLQGFWPKILDNISNSQGTLSFTDLIKAIWLLSDSDLNIDKLRAKFFGVITTPLIVACAVLILGLTAPLSSRSSGWIRQSAVPSFVTLIIWGALTAIEKIMSASLFGLWPLAVCVIFAFWAWIVWQKN